MEWSILQLALLIMRIQCSSCAALQGYPDDGEEGHGPDIAGATTDRYSARLPARQRPNQPTPTPGS